MDFPKTSLLPGPSPLEPLPRLSAHLGGDIKLYVKRDDEGGRGGGGNKLRKFERQLADALAKGADTLVIAAHPQSNAARELAGTAARFGLRCVIVSKRLIPRETESFRVSGNAMLLDLLGAEFVHLEPKDDFPTALKEVEKDLRSRGARPYMLPFGASDGLGVLGYAECADEILTQMVTQEGRAPDYIVLPCGSGGTQAGLVAGIARAKAPTRVLGFSILKDAPLAQEEVARLAREGLTMTGESGLELGPIEVDDRFRGGGYGIPTEAGLAAIRMTAQLEALFLCPVYTGKAMAGLAATIKEGGIAPGSIVVFVHTGGLPMLFAYAEAMGSGALK